MENDKGQGRISDFSNTSVFSPSHSEYNSLIPDPDAIKYFMQFVKTTTFTSADIFVKEKTGYNRIETNDIYMIKGHRDYIYIYTKKRRYFIHSTLYSILEKLPKADFIRVHNSYIVRMDRISLIHKNILTVENKQVPLSKIYKEELMSKLNILC